MRGEQLLPVLAPGTREALAQQHAHLLAEGRRPPRHISEVLRTNLVRAWLGSGLGLGLGLELGLGLGLDVPSAAAPEEGTIWENLGELLSAACRVELPGARVRRGGTCGVISDGEVAAAVGGRCTGAISTISTWCAMGRTSAGWAGPSRTAPRMPAGNAAAAGAAPLATCVYGMPGYGQG